MGDFESDSHGPPTMYITIVSVVFGGFFFMILCCICCACVRRGRKRGAIFSTPVVVTAQSYQPGGQGPYPISVQSGAASMTNAPYPHQQHQHTMPMPQYSNVSSSTAYPIHNQATPYTISASTVPNPTSTSQAQQVNPPPYSQVIGKDAYQKQPAFNPSYNS